MEQGGGVEREDRGKEFRPVYRLARLIARAGKKEILESLSVSGLSVEDVWRVQAVSLEHARRHGRRLVTAVDVHVNVGQAVQNLDQGVPALVPARRLCSVRHRLRRLDEQHLRSIGQGVGGGA